MTQVRLRGACRRHAQHVRMGRKSELSRHAQSRHHLAPASGREGEPRSDVNTNGVLEDAA